MKYIFTTHIVIFFLVCLIPRSSNGQEVLANFENFQVQGTIKSFVADEDNGLLYVGGNFSWIGEMNRNGAVVDGTNGEVMANYPEINGQVEVAISDGAGGFYIGGEFTEVGGVTRNYLAQIDASGNVTNWDPSPNQKVFALALDNGIVYAGGWFSSIGGASRSSIGAVDATTGVATSWNPGANSPVYGLEVSGSNIFAYGAFTTIGGQSRDRIAALELSTGNATSWDAGAIPNSIRCMSISNGVVYVGGTFSTIDGTARTNLAALDESTGALTSWNPGASSTVYEILADGTNIYVGGAFTTIASVSRTRLASFVESTGAITSWNPVANSSVLSLDKDGSTLYVGGQFQTIAGESRRGAAAFNTTTGNLITGFDVGGTSKSVATVAVSNSDIFVGGSFDGIGGVNRSCLAAIDVATGQVTSWDPQADGQVAELVLSGSSVYVGGYFSNVGGAARQGVAILDVTTGLATSWNANLSTSGSVEAIILGKTTLYIGGSFNAVNGTSRSNIAEVNLSDGTPTSWDPSANNMVRDMVISGNTKLYVGGSFTSIGGQTRQYISEINMSDGLATSWDPNASGAVYDIELDSDGNVFVGGSFTTIGGQARNYLAALDPTTGNATTWAPSASSTVLDLNIVDDLVYASGYFTTIDGMSRPRVAAINADGSLNSWTIDLTSSPAHATMNYGFGTFIAGYSYTVGLGHSGMIAIDRANGPATNINLSNINVAENSPVNTLVGTLSSEDDAGDTHTYALVSGQGDVDNGSFSIVGDEVYTNEVFDYEEDTYKNIRVQSVDNNGNVQEQFFGIFITNVIETGTDITSFSFQEGNGLVDIDTENHVVTIDAGDGVDRSSLTPDITVSSGATISPNTGVAQNFSGDVIYTVTAEDGSTQNWTIDAVGSLPGGTYYVKSGGDFTSLKQFMDRVNNDGIAGDVIAEITGNQDSNPSVAFVFYEHLGEENYSITLKADDTASPFELTDPLRLYGTNNFIVDGGNKMTIPSILLSSQTGNELCENITIKNTIIDASFNVWYADNLLVDGNVFDGIAATSTLTHSRLLYFYNGTVSNVTVSNNRFSYDNSFNVLANQSSAVGIQVSEDISGYANFYNNVFSIKAASANNLYGIIVSALTEDLSIHHNTVKIEGGHADWTNYAHGITVSTEPSNSLTIKNNLVVMNPTMTAIGRNVGIKFSDASVPTVDVAHNNTTYSTSGGQFDAFMQVNSTYYDDTNEATMFSLYNTTTTDPTFTDESTFDYSLTGSSLSESDFRGVPVAMVTDDFNGIARSASAPSKGAYESANNITEIVDISFTGQSGDEVIDDVAGTIDALATIGTDLSAVAVDVTTFAGSSVNPISGSTQDFSGGGVTYTVTAEAANTRDWTINISEVNAAPTDIALSNSSVDENEASNTVVGTFSTTDQNSGQSHSYTLVSGTGDDDNASFVIFGNELRTNNSFNYEVKNSFTIRVQTDDGESGLYEEAFTITVNNVWESPTGIGFTTFPNVDENNAVDDEVLTLTTTDEDSGETYTYSLVAGTGDDDNASFSITGDKLIAEEVFNYEVKSGYNIRVQTDDGNGNQHAEALFVSIQDVNDDPTAINISSAEIQEGNSINDVIGALTTDDEDGSDTHVYSLVAGTGDDDNASFNISGTDLRASEAFDYETKNAYTIRLRTDDQNGGLLEEVVLISITNLPEAPTDIALSNNSIQENNATGASIGTLTTTDVDAGETYTYTLVAGTGDDDNASFTIVGDDFRANEVFDYETKSSYTVRIQTDDGNGGLFAKSFSITITDENPETIVWDGATWSNGTGPSSTDHALFSGNYDGSFECLNLTVSSGVTLNIPANNTGHVYGDLSNLGSMTVASGGSLITYSTATISGNDITIARNTRYADGKYSFVGTPVEQSATITGSDLGSHVYKYDETVDYGSNDGLNRWVSASSDELVPGKGYTQANQLVVQFSGMPNDGTIVYNGTYTGVAGDATNEDTEGWNLVSNPYPAAINVGDFLTENTNNNGAVYFWDDNGSDTGRGDNADYVVANAIAATNTTPAGGETRYNQHIGSAQGFFVKLSSHTNTDITFTESMRVSGNNEDGAFFRTTQVPLTRINLTSQDGLFRQTVLGWIEESVSGDLDRRYDAPVFDRNSENAVFSLKNGHALAIQGVDRAVEAIPIGLNIAEPGQYEIAVEVENFTGSLILFDKQNNEYTDLTSDSYSFYSLGGEISDRFELLNKSVILEVEQYLATVVYAYRKSVFIQKPDHLTKNIKIYSLGGQVVWNGEVDESVEINLTDKPEGLYMISDGEHTWKVLLQD